MQLENETKKTGGILSENTARRHRFRKAEGPSVRSTSGGNQRAANILAPRVRRKQNSPAEMAATTAVVPARKRGGPRPED